MNLATLFIDESGRSSLAEQENEPFLLTGVILDTDETQAVEGFFRYIKRKFEIPSEKPFHSYEIYENPQTSLPNEKLIPLSNTLAEFVSLIPIKIYLIVINKNEFREALGVKTIEDFKGSAVRKEMRNYPYRVMASFLFARFGAYLKGKQAIGQIIADSRRGADHQLLKTLNLCKERAVPLKNEYLTTISDNLTALCFAEKGFLSGGLEITDLISYVSFMRQRRLLTQNVESGLPTIWEQIRKKASEQSISGSVVRRFFRIKKGEVHKYLKSKT